MNPKIIISFFIGTAVGVGGSFYGFKKYFETKTAKEIKEMRDYAHECNKYAQEMKKYADEMYELATGKEAPKEGFTKEEIVDYISSKELKLEKSGQNVQFVDKINRRKAENPIIDIEKEYNDLQDALADEEHNDYLDSLHDYTQYSRDASAYEHPEEVSRQAEIPAIQQLSDEMITFLAEGTNSKQREQLAQRLNPSIAAAIVREIHYIDVDRWHGGSEEKRQAKVLLSGGEIQQETRRFDEATQTTVSMRLKEGAVDYKYFPEPNIFPIQLDPQWVKNIQENLPELPDQRRSRYMNDYGLGSYDANVLISNKELSDFYEEVCKVAKDGKIAANWCISELSGALSKRNETLSTMKMTAAHLGALINMILDKEISGKQAKEVFEDVLEGKDPKEVAAAKGMKQVSDTSAILALINQVLDENPQSIEDFKNGRSPITDTGDSAVSSSRLLIV